MIATERKKDGYIISFLFKMKKRGMEEMQAKKGIFQ